MSLPTLEFKQIEFVPKTLSYTGHGHDPFGYIPIGKIQVVHGMALMRGAPSHEQTSRSMRGKAFTVYDFLTGEPAMFDGKHLNIPSPIRTTLSEGWDWEGNPMILAKHYSRQGGIIDLVSGEYVGMVPWNGAGKKRAERSKTLVTYEGDVLMVVGDRIYNCSRDDWEANLPGSALEDFIYSDPETWHGDESEHGELFIPLKAGGVMSYLDKGLIGEGIVVTSPICWGANGPVAAGHPVGQLELVQFWGLNGGRNFPLHEGTNTTPIEMPDQAHFLNWGGRVLLDSQMEPSYQVEFNNQSVQSGDLGAPTILGLKDGTLLAFVEGTHWRFTAKIKEE